ncbi:Na(+)/citrate cotransporter-like isoform X2 [Babylonia areolata]|uniref:Na(+)/citrate cotransporter-like isoform X2 n=1 Tax=Babylonia areolata TaxID=304850 RepID=UPI003FD30E53
MEVGQRNFAGSKTRRTLQRMRSVLSDLLVMKSPLVVFVALLAYLPLPLIVEGKESRCGYVLLVMATLWLTEAVSIPVTALLPVILFPIAGVLTAADVGRSYLSNTSLLFIGGLVVAIGVEECHLHKRVALTVLRRVGADPKWIMLGLMLPTWFLSMWISNTATASMMIPIVEAVLVQIRHASDHSQGSGSKSDTEGSTQTEDEPDEKVTFLPNNHTPADRHEESFRVEIHPSKPEPLKRPSGEAQSQTSSERKKNKKKKLQEEEGEEGDQKAREAQHCRLAKALSLCIAYSANVGGIATLTGTPPNLVLKGQVDMFFDKYGGSSPLSFVEWMGLGVPLSLLLLGFCWLWLVLVFMDRCCGQVGDDQKQAVRTTIQEEYRAMGPISFSEVETLVLFVFLALIWITRDPKFVPGWAVLFEDGYISDATGAILVAMLFFILPARKPRVFCWRSQKEVQAEGYVPLLTWKRAQEKLPWGIIILLGGGFALAKGCKISGLSLWMGQQLSAFGDLDPWLLNLIICTAVAMATEVTSNVATATLLMPIVAELAVRIGVNPLYLMSSSALATSFAFMMPVATPPNAIVFSHGHLSIPDMAKVGFVMNLVAVAVLTLAVNTWGDAIFGFSTLPDVMTNVTLRVTSPPAP